MYVLYVHVGARTTRTLNFQFHSVLHAVDSADNYVTIINFVDAPGYTERIETTHTCTCTLYFTPVSVYLHTGVYYISHVYKNIWHDFIFTFVVYRIFECSYHPKFSRLGRPIGGSVLCNLKS